MFRIYIRSWKERFRGFMGWMMVSVDVMSSVRFERRVGLAVLFPSCFDANAALFEAILGPEDAGLYF